MNVVLIDDEQIALDFFELQLREMDHVNVLGAFTNPSEGIEVILKENVDVAFLDIHIPGEDGVALARRLLHEKPELIIVFVTAHEQYAVHAFELNAVDYIVKPVRKDRLKATISRVQKKLVKKRMEKTDTEKDVLHIQLSKQFQLHKQGKVDEPIRWRTTRTKELFLLLLHNRGTSVYKDEIIELLWPDVEVEKANAQLYTTVYHIRRVIQQLGNHFTLENCTNGYVLYTRHVRIDVEVWERTVDQLPSLRGENLESYEQAMVHYQGSYLQDHSFVWAISEAERLDRKWIQIALNIAYQYDQEGNVSKAIHWNNTICERYPDVEEAHFNLMKHFAYEGKSAYVDFQYNTLVQSLEEELGVAPSSYVVKWYERWKSNKDNYRVNDLRTITGEIDEDA